MKILLIGKTGPLGADILRNKSDHEIYAPDETVFDPCSPGDVDLLINDYRPQAVINTDTFDDVPWCETDPLRAFAMNCVVVRDLARACDRINARFVTLSTDYVFDGEKNASYLEDDKPMPLQMYGITRLAGEFAALSAASAHTIIVRSCGLYGLTDPRSANGNFIDQRIKDAEAHREFVMGGDQIVSPTYTHDLSLAILRLIEQPELTPGIYHLVNEGKCSWYEFTKAIYDIMGLTVKVTAVDRSGKGGEIHRPLYSALANTKARALGITLPSWRDALERYLHKKYKTGNG